MRIRRVAVIGAGVMGRGIAGLVASAGVPVLLLDIPGGEDRDGPARKGLDKALKDAPPAFRDPGLARLVTVGNTEDDLGRLASYDWVVEAIPERPELKRALLERLEEVVGDRTLVTTNTSGIPITLLLRGRGEPFRSRFFGTHFFNPPRVMRLLEVIEGPDTDPESVRVFEEFSDRILGKGVVRARDVPGFIANRLGIHGIVDAMRLTEELGLGVAEVDALTGPLLGRPASAIYRTADLVGLDVLVDATDGIAAGTGEALELPRWVRALVEDGRLGAKSGAGFYRKEEGRILEVDPATGEYHPRESAEVEGLRELARRPIGDRLAAALELSGVHGEFLRSLLASDWHYTLSKAPELAFDLPSVDRAMEWGFGWELGPFRQMDAVGADRVRELLRAEGGEAAIPELLERGGGGFYRAEGRVVDLGGGEESVRHPPGTLTAARLRHERSPLLETPGSSLLDMGDEVALLAFRTRMGTLGDDVVRGILDALSWIDREGWQGLVIGHDDPRAFSAGADLREMLRAAREQRWEEMDGRIRAFQNMILSIRRAPFPVVAAPAGLTLAGGAEVVLHADHVQSHVELQIGLVEAGVGLLPAGGGTKELLVRYSTELERHGAGELAPAMAARHAFLRIATAEVTSSAAEARARGWLRAGDGSSANRDRLLSDARSRVTGLVSEGYVPPPEHRVTVGGDGVLGDLLVMAEAQREAGRASEHDLLVAREIATVLSGGGGAPREVSETELMEFEREGFLRLLGTAPTLERIEHMLETGKPLRN